MYSTILVPVDGSDHSRLALDLASKLISGESPTIHLLNVPELPPLEGHVALWTQGGAGGQIRQAVEADARRILEEAEASVEKSGIQFQHHLFWTPPAMAIVTAAEDLKVEVIVLGSRGLGNLKGLIIGSVSNKVLHSATCRVVLVH